MDLAPLVDSLPEGCVLTDPDRLAGYRWDRAQDQAAGMPLAVVRARSTEHVQIALRHATEHGLAVVPRGAGSGLSGGASAVDGCLVVDVSAMTDVAVDPDTRTVTAGAGATNAAVKAAAAEHGLWYPPDPASWDHCTVGGNVATNAGGLCCVKYGVTRDYVLGMTVVLADGTAVELGGPLVKDVAGLSLTHLFIGSEGTLGVITRVVLRLVPQPQPPATLVALFASLDAAAATVVELTRTSRPAMLELMDRAAIAAVDDLTHMGLDRGAEALLIIQSDDPDAADRVHQIADVCDRQGATEVLHTADPAEGEAFVAARRAAVPAVEKRGSLLLEDVGVPVPRLGDLLRGIADVARRHDVFVAVVAHAGDGNTHPLLAVDRSDADQVARAERAFAEIMDLAVDLGGTITGEHGVGRLKRPWLERQLGADVVALNQRVKDALDPRGLLNPGAGL